MKKGYKEYHVVGIFLLVIFAVLLFSCEKNNKPSEENKGQLFESTDNSEVYGDKQLSDDSAELPFPIPFKFKKESNISTQSYTLLYKYENELKKEDYDLVIADYTQEIQIDPNRATPYLFRGKTYHDKGDTYHDKEDYGHAIADYTQVIRITPNYADVYFFRGNAYNNIGDYDLAIVDFDQAIQLYPGYENPYRHRAFAYMKKGNYTQARADVNKALEINPNYQSAQELSAELQRLGY